MFICVALAYNVQQDFDLKNIEKANITNEIEVKKPADVGITTIEIGTDAPKTKDAGTNTTKDNSISLTGVIEDTAKITGAIDVITKAIKYTEDVYKKAKDLKTALKGVEDQKDTYKKVKIIISLCKIAHLLGNTIRNGWIITVSALITIVVLMKVIIFNIYMRWSSILNIIPYLR